MSPGGTYCLESGVATNPFSSARVSSTGAYWAIRGSSEVAGFATWIRYSFIPYQVEREKGKKRHEKYANRTSWLQITCTLASPGNEEAHRSSMKAICNWVGSNTSGVAARNCENSCGETFLKYMCWHLSAGRSQVRRLLQRGWIPPHSAVCKELVSSPGIICGGVRRDINSFWHAGEKWEHLKGLLCHSLSSEGKKTKCCHGGHGLGAPGPGLLCIILMLMWETLLVAGKAGVRSYLRLFQAEARSYRKLIAQITAARVASDNHAAIFRDLCTQPTNCCCAWVGPHTQIAERMSVAKHKLATPRNKFNTSA